ncbi:MAG: deoxyribodipyrimidine photo-lyase [Phaeodactylibacter sp.]|nr:deoxyribodipyrimidine photo-lyase [Phaeodactylibacter sp.]MCB9297773.1 deoxyribodipyrimidine photo-lyase [Lewinellaceae bacterium]
MSDVCFFWFRRDLRLHDNAGLYHALKGERPVVPLFIFDREILDELEDKKDARVEFIHDTLREMRQELRGLGSSMVIRYGHPLEVWKTLLEEYDIGAVYANRDYEPYAIQRDEKVQKLLKEKGAAFHTFKDHVVFEKDEVLKDDGEPYVVFTPYSRKWKEKLDSRPARAANGPGEEETISYYLKPYSTEDYFGNFLNMEEQPLPGLEEMGFERTDIGIPPKAVSRGLIRNYDKTRNFPAQDGTSRLGIHFRFGTISIREKARRARQLNATFLNELIWRDFYAMILAHFPHVVGRAFREKYDYIEWRNDESEFQKWCEGKTGYPIVDAGMRQLNQAGYMHNRVRMITASFLAKHLLIDWRWGEAYFAKKLLDYELASNNGGWQWAAGSGTDAAPYFRIFNPYSQQEKFDKDLKYVKKWVPEYGTSDYPDPIVDHKEARERCLETYKAGLSRAEEG